MLGTRLSVVAIAGLLASGCGDGGTADRAGQGAAGAPAAPAAAAAEGGFCAEHGVAEAVCTKCHPKLAVIFKAKGDWCAEHGLPESFCPTCHPERGGRPAADIAADDTPLDGTQVLFRTQAAVTAAGIEAQPALEAAAGGALEVLATIVYDVTRHALVNPPLPGIVRALLVEEGASVAKGAPLATIESAEVAAELSRLAAARSRQAFAEAARTRAKGLLDTGMATKRDVLEAEREIAAASADIAAATGALGLAGVEDGAVNTYTLRAPLAGTVLHLSGAAGRMLDTGDVLCEVVDASIMWAELEIPEAELGRVTKDLDVVVTAEALPGREFRGRIDTILPEVDPRTRTAKARVRLANPDGVLRAHMYVRARIVLPRSSARALVPLDALQRAGAGTLVFVQLAPERYETRRVRVGARRDGMIEILQGVEPGEPVATRGSFLLKTETLKGSIGAGCCEVE